MDEPTQQQFESEQPANGGPESGGGLPGFSLRNPYLILVGALMALLLGVTAFFEMEVDVFPPMKMPAVVVATFYPGMPPLDIEQDITTRYERFLTLGSGIEHIQSRSLPGVSIITVYFHADVDADVAAAQMGVLAMGDLGVMPPGTLPPLVLKYDVSSLPAVLVTVSGKGYSQTQLEDQARYNVRNFLATVKGASVPIPFGGRFRQVMAYVDRRALQARGLTLMDVVNALNQTNVILPAGDAKIGNTDYYIYSNSMAPNTRVLNEAPIKIGPNQAPVLMRDLGQVEDSSQIQYNVVLVNGQPSVYVPVLKQTGANTLDLVDGVRAELPKVRGLPAGMHLETIYSQAKYIRDAMRGLEHEVFSGSLLASLMILLFLASVRSTFAIFLSIPLSICAALFLLFLNGSTINIMTLGGFALAVGRLVDDSTVVLENINRHLTEGEEPKQAARRGAVEVTYAVLASTITTIIVFFPVLFLYGVAKYLFTALALAVVFSMSASYVVSMSLVPLFCARFLTVEEARRQEAMAQGSAGRGFFAWFNRGYRHFNDWFANWLGRALDHKALIVATVTAIFLASMTLFPRLGTQLFPTTDAGKFTINITTPPGTRIELTTRMARRIGRVVRQVVPPEDLKLVVSNLGLAPSISAIYSTNSGEDTGQIFVSLKKGHKRSVFYYMDRLAEVLPKKVPQVQSFFSSGSIIDAVLNFGMPAPIDIQVSGWDFRQLFTFADRIKRRVDQLPEVGHSFIPQIPDYPTLDIVVDRQRAGRLGLTQKDVVTNVITALDNNMMIAPSIWIDRANGNDYFLTAQYREPDINRLETVMDIPVGTHRMGYRPLSIRDAATAEVRSGYGHNNAVLLRNVADVRHAYYPSEADHYDIQRVIDVYVAPATSDWGGTQEAVERAVAKLKPPPHVKLFFRGSVVSMEQSFSSFGVGLALAIIMVYLVGVAQGRSWLDPFIFLFSIPMGLIGVALLLWATGTTLNIESFMGIIVMIGIVHSNAILLIDFANERRREGMPLRKAATEAARIRMRPILMTTLATLAGLAPIALKIGEGSEASAPLARAVIGGLAVSTVMTLVLVPALWELFYSWKQPQKAA